MSAVDRLIDLRPLRTSPAFRRFWLGSTASGFGHQVALVAVLLQVWQITASPVWVGVTGLARAVPMLGCSLLGGSLADAVDRRRLVLWATAGGMAGSVLLAGQAVAGLDSLPLVLGLVAGQAAAGGLGAPARRALIPRLLPAGQVAAGIALGHLSFQAGMLAGPALAGLVAAGWGVAACYLVTAGTGLAALYGVARLPPIPPTAPSGSAAAGRSRSPVRDIVAGWRLVARRPVLRGSLLTDLAATLLAMPVSLFPAVNQARFGGDPRTLGLFLSAIAVGGIAASLTSGAVTRHPRPGQVMLLAAAVWGVALAGFGLAVPLWLAIGCLVVAGAADTVSVISRGSIVQLATPDSHRGRVSAVEHVVGVTGPDFGNFRGGLVAGLSSAPVALVSGGLLAALGVAAVAATTPALRRFRTGHSGQDRTATPG
jgi:MFS family permease